MFYALWLANPGSATSFNGEAVDQLLEFDTEYERDCAIHGEHTQPVKAREARKMARDIYGVPFSKLCRRSAYGMPGCGNVMIVDPDPA